MEVKRLIKNSDPLYPEFRKIYDVSFPIFEQRTEEQQLLAFQSQEYHLDCYTEEARLIGFIAYWDFGNYLYIEHFAINQTIRSKGYGSFILKDLEKRKKKRLLLEIDPVTDEISTSRLHFYQRNGFSENPYPHTHPPYRDGFKGHKLVVLTTNGQITAEEYKQFNTDLTTCVMNFK